MSDGGVTGAGPGTGKGGATGTGPGTGTGTGGATGTGPGTGKDGEPVDRRAERDVRGKRGKRGGSREELMVPEAEFRSYYGRPIVRAPVWKHDIAAYLFTGGLAAGSALLGAGGDLSGRPALRRAGRLAALGAIGASTYFLIADLGRPARFHHMLRIARPTSPMSMGTWILSAFGGAAAVAAAAELAPAILPGRGVLGRAVPVAGRAAGLASAVAAPALATYTAVLLADTATPSWHEAYPELPFVFGGSALASGAGVGLIAAPPAQNRPAVRMAVAGAALELAASHRIEHRLGLLSEPYREGRAGRLLRLSRTLTVAGTVGAVLGRRSRVISALSGVALLAGSAATRFGIYDGGVASAKDPKYTVIPQRARRAAREAGGE